MKTKLINKHRFTKIFFLLTVLMMLLPPTLPAQDVSKDEKISREFDVTGSTAISFENKVGDLLVETWNQNKVKLDAMVYVKAEDAEDVQSVLDAIKNLEFTQGSTSLNINTRFYESFISQDNLINQKITLKLLDGTKIKLKELRVSYVLTIPSGNEFSLIQKYEDVNLADLNGKVTLEIYSCDLKAGKLPNAYRIDLKYASADIASIGNTILEVYDSKMDVVSAGNLDLSSKYSEMNIEKCGDLKLDIYDDKLNVSEHGNVKGEGKYTTLILNNFSLGDLSLYDCTFKAGKVDEFRIVAKYSKIDLVSARKFRTTECYDNQVTLEYAGDMHVTSKYTTFTIDELASSLYLDSYDDKVNIFRVNSDFTSIELNGKYTNLALTMQTGAQYKIIADLQYTDLKFPGDRVQEIRYHKEGSNFQFKGITKGADEATAPVIKLMNYSGEIVIND